VKIEGDDNVTEHKRNIPAPTVPGNHYYYIYVTAPGDEDDSSETNTDEYAKVTVLPPTFPDLVVPTLTVDDSTLNPSQNFTINATVKNQGNGSSAASTLRYYRSSDATITTADIPLGTDSIPGLAANGTSTQSISVAAPSVEGTFWIGACVDAVSGESNTGNNCSSEVIIDVRELPPANPSNLQAVAATESAIELAWTDNSSNEDGFRIDRSTNATDWATIATPTANTTSFEDLGLMANTTYYYRILAYNSGGASSWSEIMEEKTLPIVNEPNLRITGFTMNEQVVFGTGQEITLFATTFNDGGDVYSDIKVEWYISEGDTYNNPNFIAQDNIQEENLGAGAAILESTTFIAPLITGIYTVSVHTDAMDELSESDEDDNWGHITFEVRDLRADVNGDGVLMEEDQEMIFRYSAGYDQTEEGWIDTPTTGDVNCSGDATTADAQLVMRKLSGQTMYQTAWCDEDFPEIRADVNNDGVISIADVQLVYRKSQGLDMSETPWLDTPSTGDVNCDLVVDQVDVDLIYDKFRGYDMAGTGWCDQDFPDNCNGDFDSDHDVDGLDLLKFRTDFMNGQVDENDLIVFSENFGKKL
jgi:hypothetical protein